MPFSYWPATITALEVWEVLQSLVDVEGSMGVLARMAQGERTTLQDHFDAITLGDLSIAYTLTAVGGGAVAFLQDELPSAIQMQSGGGGGDSITLESDKTVSHASLGQQTIHFEARMRISSEANIEFRMGLSNDTVNADRVWVTLDTNGGAPVNDGVLYTNRNGAATNTDANLVSGLDLTLWHVYELIYTPGTDATLLVDGAVRATHVTNIPEDQAFVPYFYVHERGGGARNMEIDYYKVWSE